MLNGGDAALLQAQLDITNTALGPVDATVYDFQSADAARRYPELRIEQSLVSTHEGRGLRARAALAVRLGRVVLAAPALRRGNHRLARLIAGPHIGPLRTYAAADLVMTSGGTFMMSRYRPYTRYVDHWLVYALGRPLVFFTQGFECPAGRLNRWLLGWTLSRATLVLARGQSSGAVAAELGAQRVQVVPDAAFALAQTDRRTSIVQRSATVAISVRDWPYMSGGAPARAAYDRAIAGLVRHLVHQLDTSVTFISTCQGAPTYRFDDSRAAMRIVELLPSATTERVTIDSEFHRWDALRDLLTAFDLVVATRLHVGILAVSAGIPVLPIAYEAKTLEVFADLGLRDLVLQAHLLDSAGLIQAYDRLASEAESVRNQLLETVPRLRRDALASGRFLQDALPVRSDHET
jgi:colanic acid/amylovoran biosynthesis protein